MGYGEWLHGEAVSAGTLIAMDLSQRLGMVTVDEVFRVKNLFIRAGLPVSAPGFGAERYLELMRHDKKVEDGKLRLVLLEKIGKAVISDAASEQEILASINAACT